MRPGRRAVAAFLVLTAAFIYPLRTFNVSQSTGEVSTGRSAPRLAATATQFFAVWNDSRRSSHFRKVYGSFVEPTGTVVTPSGLELGVGSLSQQFPSVACVATACLIAWDDSVVGIATRLVTTTGGVGPLVYANTSTRPLIDPSVTRDGMNFIVSWIDADNSIRARRFDGVTGAPGGVEFIVSAASARTRSTLNSFPASASVAVAWTENTMSGYDVYAQVVDPTGPVGAPLLIGSTGLFGWVPAVTSDNSLFMMAWVNLSGDLVARRFTQAGTQMEASPVTLVARGAAPYASPAVAFDGNAYLVAYGANYRDLMVLKANTGFLLVQGNPTLVTSDWLQMTGISLVQRGSPGLIAWERDRGVLEPWVGSLRIDSPSGLPVSPVDAGFITQQGSEGVRAVSATWAGDHFALALARVADLSTRVTLTTLDPNGTLLSSTLLNDGGMPLLSGTGLAQSGDDTVVLLTDAVSPQLIEVDATPAVRAPYPFGPNYYSASPPAVVSRERDVMAMWGVDAPTGRGIAKRAWLTSGAATTDAGMFLTNSGIVHDVSLAPTATGFLVGWKDDLQFRVAFADLTGTMRGTPLTVDTQVASVAVAASPVDHLLVWSVYGDDRVLARHLDLDGGLVESTTLSLGTGGMPQGDYFEPVHPSVAFDGVDYLVAWEHYDVDAGTADIRLLRLALDGGQRTITLDTSATEPEAVLVTAGTPGRALVSWQRWNAVNKEVELVARVVAEVPLLSECGSSSECAVGGAQCIARFCCPRATPCVGAGPVDAGDGGGVDAGVPDAGTNDGGPGDGGSDGGLTDAGSDSDAGAPARRNLAIGCGCQSSPTLAVLLASLAALRRRRRA